MPIRPDLRQLYPADWPERSLYVRSDRARWRCEACGIPEGTRLDILEVLWPDQLDLLPYAPRARAGERRVVLSVAHLDHDPSNNDPNNLRALCQRCHNLHDLDHRLASRSAHQRCDLTLDLFACPTRLNGGYKP